MQVRGICIAFKQWSEIQGYLGTEGFQVYQSIYPHLTSQGPATSQSFDLSQKLFSWSSSTPKNRVLNLTSTFLAFRPQEIKVSF